MSTRNYTQEILPSECIGDSLLTINNNFATLDTDLWDVVTRTVSVSSTPTIALQYDSTTRLLSANLALESITTEYIAISAITTNRIANNAVTRDKILDGEIISSKFPDGSITNLKLGLNSVTTDKIIDNAISPIKLSLGAPFWNTSGRVGIGTNVPESSLQVVGGIRVRGGAPGAFGASNNGYAFSGNGGDNDSGMYSTGDGRIEFYTDSTETMRLQTGNVGIGTINPTTKLHVYSTGTVARFSSVTTSFNTIDMQLTDASASATRGTEIITTNESGVVVASYVSFLNTNGSSDVFITTTPAGSRTIDRKQTRLFISGSGNVGIGTQTPQTTLDVVGSIRASEAFFNTSANRVLISDGTSRVTSASINTTELGHLAGITSNIQIQLNNRVISNAAITPNTNTKITYDSKGLVTGGTNLVATDIPSHIIATNTGLGPQHAISGATVGQVLRATGATTAAFQNLIETDIPNLNANKITAGILDIERVPAIPSGKLTAGGPTWNTSGEVFANIFNNNHTATTRPADTIFYSSANESDKYIRRNTREGFLDALGITSGISQLIPSFANLRISPSVSFPVVTTDHNNVTSIHIHPFNGNIVSFYNTATNRWDVREIPGVLTFSLGGLTADTNFDIFLWHNGSTFQIDFTPWPSSSRGTNTGSAKTLLNGVKVKTGSLNRRYIGCLRTTITGSTSVTFGREWILGGSHPKFFIWNNQNRFSAAFSILEGSNWASAGPGNGAAGNMGPFSNFGWRNASTPGTGNRVSFITGESAEVAIHQHHGIGGGGAYPGHIMDLEQSDNIFTHHFHRQGQHLVEYDASISSNFTAPPGYHYVQLMMLTSRTLTFSLFEVGPGGDSRFPGGRHSWGTTGSISDF